MSVRGFCLVDGFLVLLLTNPFVPWVAGLDSGEIRRLVCRSGFV